jgi:hypothetical protein
LTLDSNKLAAAAQAAIDLDAKQALRRDGTAFKLLWRDAINTDHTLTQRQQRVGNDIARRVYSTTMATKWISDAEIADFLKLTRTQVCEARKELQRRGWIHRKAGRFKSKYTLCGVNIVDWNLRFRQRPVSATADRHGIPRNEQARQKAARASRTDIRRHTCPDRRHGCRA